MYDEAWEKFYQLACTGLARLPLPNTYSLSLASEMQHASRECETHGPAATIARYCAIESRAADAPYSANTAKQALQQARGFWQQAQNKRIALQEELDLECYQLYGLLDANLSYGKPLPQVRLGERAFEIVMARRMAAEDLTTSWFQRHNSTPITDIPSHWPADYRDLVQKRIDAITSDKNIGLI